MYLNTEQELLFLSMAETNEWSFAPSETTFYHILQELIDYSEPIYQIIAIDFYNTCKKINYSILKNELNQILQSKE